MKLVVARCTAVGLIAAASLAGCGGGHDDELATDSSALLQPARPLSATELAGAADTVRARLEAAGIDDVEISPQDGALRLAGPQSSVDAAVPLAQQRDVVRFRLVLAETSGSGTSTSGATSGSDLAEVAAAYADWDCAGDGNATDGEDLPAEYMVACDDKGDIKYVLSPSDLDSTTIVESQANLDEQTNTWLVTLQFDTDGGRLWFDLTKQAYQATAICPTTPDPAGCNQIGMIRDGVVLSAPASQQPGIRGGATQITGNFTEQSAKRLAAELAGGALPTEFSLS